MPTLPEYEQYVMPKTPAQDSSFLQETAKAPARVVGDLAESAGAGLQYVTGDRVGGGLRGWGQKVLDNNAITPGFAAAHPVITDTAHTVEPILGIAASLAGDALLSSVAPELGIPAAVGTIATGIRGARKVAGALGEMGALSSKVLPVMFGASTGQKSYEAATQQGMSSGDALQASIPAALVSGAGMALMGPAGKLGRGLLPKAAQAAEGGVVKSIINPESVLRTIGSSVAVDAPVMMGTNMATAAAQQAEGIKPAKTPGEIVKDPKEWMSAALAGGMFGALHAVQGKVGATRLKGALETSETPTRFTPEKWVEERRKVVDFVGASLPEGEQRDYWLTQAHEAVRQGQPIAINDALLSSITPPPEPERAPTPEAAKATIIEGLTRSATTGEAPLDALHNEAVEATVQDLAKQVDDIHDSVQQRTQDVINRQTVSLPTGKSLAPEIMAELDAQGYTLAPKEVNVSAAQRTGRVSHDYEVIPKEEAARRAAVEAQNEETRRAAAQEESGPGYSPEQAAINGTEPPAGAGSPEAGSGNAAEVGNSASVKMFLTRDDHQALAELGYGKTARDKLTPQEGADIITEGRRYKKAGTAASKEAAKAPLGEEPVEISPGVHARKVVRDGVEQIQVVGTDAQGRRFPMGTAEKNSRGEFVPDDSSAESVEGGAALRKALKDAGVKVGERFSLAGNPDARHVAEVFNRRLGTDLKSEDVGFEEPQPGLSEVGKLFGSDIKLFKVSKGVTDKTLPEGFVSRNGKTVYLNAESKHPLLTILGHEITHQMEQTQPELYAELKTHLEDLIDAENYMGYADRKRQASSVYDAMGFDQLHSEVLGDFVGNQFGKPGFWNKLAEKNPELFGKLITLVQRALESIKSTLAGLKPADKIVTDLKRAEQVVATTMAKYAELVKTEALKPEKPVTPEEAAAQFSFATPQEAEKSVTDATKPVVTKELWRAIKSGAMGLWQTIMPVDRVINMVVSLPQYRPIAEHLRQLQKWQDIKGHYAQAVVGDADILFNKHIQPLLKTDADIKNFSRATYALTLYQMTGENGKVTDDWTTKSWAKSGLKKATGKSLEEARAEAAEAYKQLSTGQQEAHKRVVGHLDELRQTQIKALETSLMGVWSPEDVAGARSYNEALDEAKLRADNEWTEANRGGATPEELETLKQQQNLEQAALKHAASDGALALSEPIRRLDSYKSLKGDFFPLQRFGDHVIAGTVDGRPYRSQHTTQMDANLELAELQKNQENKVWYDYQNQASVRETTNIPLAFLDKYKQLLEGRGIDEGQVSKIVNDATALWVNTISQYSYRSHLLERKSVAGFDMDVHKTYMTYARQYGQAIANTRYGGHIDQLFRDINNRIDEHAKGGGSPESVEDMRRVYNQLYAQHVKTGSTEILGITKALTRGTFLYYLTSPAVMAVQWSQPFMFTIPKLAATHGFDKAMAAFSRSGKNYISGRYSDAKIDDFETRHEGLGRKTFGLLEQIWRLDADVQTPEVKQAKADISKQFDASYEGLSKADQELLTLSLTAHQGLKDLSLSHNAMESLRTVGSLSALAESKVAGSASLGSKAWNWLTTLASMPMQKSETGSRAAAAVSAVELARAKGLSYAEAHAYAREVITETLFNFSTENRAEWMRTNTGRILGQFQLFRFHTLGQTVQLTRDAFSRDFEQKVAAAELERKRNTDIWGELEANEMFNKEKAQLIEKRKTAQKELAYVTGMGMALAGAAGTPLAMIASNTVTDAMWEGLKLLFSDPDNPWNPVQDLENAIKESIGDTATSVLFKGLPALLGWDISKRVGASGMANFIQGDPPPNIKGTELMNWYAGRILGPSFGMASDSMRAWESLQDGDTTQAVQSASPKFIKDFAKMLHVSQEGVQAGGRTIYQPEEFNGYQAALMMIGINPLEISLAQEKSREVGQLSANLSARRSSLLKDYVKATKDDDGEARDKVLEAVNQWGIKQPKLKITYKELISAHRRALDKASGKMTKREEVLQAELEGQ